MCSLLECNDRFSVRVCLCCVEVLFDVIVYSFTCCVSRQDIEEDNDVHLESDYQPMTSA